MIEYAVLLAGGEGTRLRPFTHYTSKHLLPVNDKPMIFYPLKNLILLGVKNVCIVINPKHYDQWKVLLNNLELNINIELVIQDSAEGIPHALKLCEKYIRQRDHFLALGDNILIGPEMMKNFSNIVEKKNGAAIIGYPVKNTQDFGVAEFNNNGKLLKVIEKPTKTKSNLAVVGLYKFDADVFSMFDQLQKSKKG